MADQGLWFKLWCSADDDPDLDNLDVADFGRFCKAGLLVKSQGTVGTITLRPPSRTLCAKFQVPDFDALHAALLRLPHVSVRRENDAVTSETTVTVTFHNWAKYQGDFSTPRVRSFRQRKRSRGEEKRRDENETRGEVTPTAGRVRSRPHDLTIEDIVERYGSREEYASLDVRQSALRLLAWCETNRAKPTQKRVTNWLNGDALRLAATRRSSGNGTATTGRAAINDAWKGQPGGDTKL